jgi:hypothetical protein
MHFQKSAKMVGKWELLIVLCQTKVYLKDWIWCNLNIIIAYPSFERLCIYGFYWHVYRDVTQSIDCIWSW